MSGLDYFSDSDSDSELCDHDYTITKHGSRICLTCGLKTGEIRHVPEEGYEDRVFIKNTGPDHVVEIREKMKELMDMVVKSEAGLPYEIYEYSEELCQVCNEYKLPEGHLWKKAKRNSPIQSQTRSLCAAVLWEKVKSLYPISMAEFAKRVGVSKPTIINTCKKMRQIDLN